MPDYVPIQDLTIAGSVGNDDLFPMSDGLGAYAVKGSTIKSFAASDAAAAAADAAASKTAAQAAEAQAETAASSAAASAASASEAVTDVAAIGAAADAGIDANNLLINTGLSYVNYGYDQAYNHPATSGAYASSLGVKRDKNAVILNHDHTIGYNIVLRLSGAYAAVSSNADVQAWSSGFSLKAGHEYIARCKYVSGVSKYESTSTETNTPPVISIYRVGESSSVGDYSSGDGEVSRKFTAEDGVQYNLALYIAKTYWLFTDAKFIVTLEDFTESISGKMSAEVDTSLSAFDEHCNAADDLINYGYNFTVETVREEVPSSETSTKLGVVRRGTIVELDCVGADYVIYCRITNGLERAIGSSNVRDWVTGISLTEGKNYRVIMRLLSGTVSGDGKPSVSVYAVGTSSSMGVSSRDGEVFTREFTAGSTQLNLVIYVPENTVLSNARYDITLQELSDTEEGVPGYYFDDDYLPGKISTILGHSEDDSIYGDMFFWWTDPHFWHKYPTSETIYTENQMKAVPLIQYIQARTNIRKVFCGGDLGNGANIEHDLSLQWLIDAKAVMAPIWGDVYNLIGNHEYGNLTDDQYADEMLSSALIYSILIKDKEREFGSISSRGDYWFDNQVQKIRYFCLGSSETSILTSTQIRWFGTEMETVPAGYTVVVMSHLGLDSADSYRTTFGYIAGILDAAKTSSVYQYTAGTSFDYTNLDIDVACVISGHVHADYSKLTDEGIPVISTACDRGPTQTSSDSFNANRQPGTINEQVFDVVQIDLTNRKIYLTRIGAGQDRSFDF